METCYKEMYIRLFRAVELAVRYLDENKPVSVKAVLKLAQSQCEEIFIEYEQKDSP